MYYPVLSILNALIVPGSHGFTKKLIRGVLKILIFLVSKNNLNLVVF